MRYMFNLFEEPYRSLIGVCFGFLGVLMLIFVGYIVYCHREELYCSAYYRANRMADSIGKWTDAFYDKYYNCPDYADRKLYVQSCIVKKKHRRH